MLLSKLVYLAIKNITYFDDMAFTYEAFLQGKYNHDSDYATNINNIFTPINEAISRLSDLERIPYRVESVNVSLIENNILLFNKLNHNVKQVISIAQVYGSNYRPLEWRVFGADAVKIDDYIDKDKPVYIEYKEDIEQFDIDSFYYHYVENENEVLVLDQDTVRDIELRELGITDSVANYIMEYAMGKLAEQIAPELANMHITRSEQYFNNVHVNKSAFPQKEVFVNFGVE